MSRVRKVLFGGALVVLLLPVLGVGALYWQISNPAVVDLPLPDGMESLHTPAGQAALQRSWGGGEAELIDAFQVQEKGTWCGVASGAAALTALGTPLTQEAWFTPESAQVRPWWKVTFGGMTLAELADMAATHGAEVTTVHAEGASEAVFRQSVRVALARPEVVLIANYHRATAGEDGGGHHSPLGGYDPATDRVLVLDTAGYKYPPHWVPVSTMFTAMSTTDSSSGRSRGWLLAKGEAPPTPAPAPIDYTAPTPQGGAWWPGPVDPALQEWLDAGRHLAAEGPRAWATTPRALAGPRGVLHIAGHRFELHQQESARWARAFESSHVAWSPSGDRLAFTADPGHVVLLDAATGAATQRLVAPSDGGVRELAFSPDGTELVVVGTHGHSRFELASGTATHTQTATPWSERLALRGRWLAKGSLAHVEVVDLADNQLVSTTTLPGELQELRWADDALVAVHTSGESRWTPSGWRHPLAARGSHPGGLAFAGDRWTALQADDWYAVEPDGLAPLGPEPAASVLPGSKFTGVDVGWASVGHSARVPLDGTWALHPAAQASDTGVAQGGATSAQSDEGEVVATRGTQTCHWKVEHGVRPAFVAVTPDGSQVAWQTIWGVTVASMDGCMVEQAPPAEPERVDVAAELGLPLPSRLVALRGRSPDGGTVVVQVGKELELWRLDPVEQIGTVPWGAAPGPGAAAAWVEPVRGVCVRWGPVEEHCRQLREVTDSEAEVVWSHDGKTLLVAHKDGWVTVPSGR